MPKQNDPSMDTYLNYAVLAQSEKEDTDYHVRLYPREKSTLVIIAPHGGAIEPGTSEIAIAVAGDDFSYALFEGIKPRKNGVLHVTSGNFDEPRCCALVGKARQTLAIHGEKNPDEKVAFLGGKDAKLILRIRASLEQHGFVVKPHPSPWLQGTDSANICNRNLSGAGVQLELTEALRRTFFVGLDATSRKQPTAQLGQFAKAVREGLHQASVD